MGIRLIAGLLLVVQVAVAQQYPSLEQFGRNRIQYRKFDWKVIKTSNFEIYFYQEGNSIANLAAQYAETEFDRITEVLGYTPYNRVKVFIYNSPQDLSQSNIGMSVASGVDGRELDLAKSRLELAFTGNQISFRKQLIREVSMLFVYDMLYGGSLKDALQSSLLLSLPDWFMPGIASYIAEGWSVDLDDYMRDVVVNRPIRKPSILIGEEAMHIGHSIWNYIAERYGKDNISNILNLTRIIRNEQSSIASTLGMPYSRFLREWREYYSSMAKPIVDAYQPGEDNLQLTISSLKERSQLTSLQLSPDQGHLAYAIVRRGKFEVAVINTSTQKKKIIRVGGYKQDESLVRLATPLVAWQRNQLLVLTDEKGKTFLYCYTNIDGHPRLKQRQVVRGVNQVIDMSASDDGTSVIFSADRQGQNDLYLYSLGRGTIQQLTNDLYDDLYPKFVGRSRQIVFASNRFVDSLGTKGSYKMIRNHLSLFLHEGNPGAEVVTRLTDSLSVAMRPIAGSEHTVYYLDDATGIRNLVRFDIESKAKHIITSFSQSIRSYDLNPTSGALVYSQAKNGGEVIGFRSKVNLGQSLELPKTRRVAALVTPQPVASQIPSAAGSIEKNSDSTRAVRLILAEGEVDTDNYTFDDDVLKATGFKPRRTPLSTPTSSMGSRSRRRENVTIRGPFAYRGLFVASDASSDWRIDPIRGFGYFQSLTMNDLLENHVIRAGLFITTNLRNSDLFAEYNNLVNRVDYSVRFDRKTIFNDSPIQKFRFNKVTVAGSYPLSVNSRFTLAPFYIVTRGLNLSDVNDPDQASDFAGLKGEFVFDNTMLNGMNMIEGTRFKLRYENYAGFRSASESFNRITLDLRHYQKIHRDIILATRLSFSRSGGHSPKKSTMGGMENWISFQGSTKDPDSRNPLFLRSDRTRDWDNRDVFFLELATPLRGFRQGKLTGTSHVLFNAELRLPVVRYLHRGPVTSNFLRNFQLVAFSDIGTAWAGKGPFSRQNSLNTEVIGGKGDPFQATVTNFKNPFLIGYGAGARTMLFGYYVKFDYAWGLEDNIVGAPIAYLTLGYDF